VSETIEPELITIIEGPTPEFHLVADPWAFSILEGASPFLPAACQVRSFNGGQLLERCQRAWSTQRPILLDYRQMDGLRRKVEIVGARLEKIEGIDVLNFWVRHPVGAVRLNPGRDDSGPIEA
jgi:hypothetical protein